MAMITKGIIQQMFTALGAILIFISLTKIPIIINLMTKYPYVFLIFGIGLFAFAHPLAEKIKK